MTPLDLALALGCAALLLHAAYQARAAEAARRDWVRLAERWERERTALIEKAAGVTLVAPPRRTPRIWDDRTEAELEQQARHLIRVPKGQ